MKPTSRDLQEAVIEMGMCRYFPSDEATRGAIMRLLERMCSTPEQLRWLVRAMVDKVGEWKGPAELRGIFCTRFKPADRVEMTAISAGFSDADLERKSYELHGSLKHGCLPSPEIKALALRRGM